MNEDFVMYHKFTVYDTLKDFSEELAKNGIGYDRKFPANPRC
jgi:hypothetical protein